MAHAIYREWFVRLRYPDYEGETFIDSPLGPIPRGWVAQRIGSLVSTQYGYTESAQTESVGPKFLRGMDMNKTSFIDWSSVPYCKASEEDQLRFGVKPNDVFVIRMADPGKVSICELDVKAVFASYLVRLRPTDDRLTPYYLFFTLRDDRYQDWVTGASTGATRKSVSAKVMTEPLIVLPPARLQARFVSAVAPMRSMLMQLVRSNAQLRLKRDFLLSRVMTGQIDLSQLKLHAVMGSVS